jgi:hypothetical protein
MTTRSRLTRSRLFNPLLVLLAALIGLAAVPALAAAETIKVDDDRAQCPLAEYTALTAAVAKAANGDTIHVCAGTYTVPSGSPSSGLKIEKNLNIEGAGAGKVFVQPATEPGTSLAQPAPNPRDEYGNIITVRRRLIELTDVSISGLTVRAQSIPVEAGIAMIDVENGLISGVAVEGIAPTAGPGTGAYAPPEPLATQGQGIIVADTIEASDDETVITGSEVKGFNATGILVDNRLLDGSGSVGNESHMVAKVVSTKITGFGPTAVIGQTGIEAWGSGTRLSVTKSRISKVGKADETAAAIALHGVNVPGSVVGGEAASRDNFLEDLYGITNVAYDGSPAASSLNATGNWWGATSGVPNAPIVGAGVTTEPVATEAIAEPALAPVLDLPPTIEWDTRPANGSEVTTGTPLQLATVAGDDFGVTKVEYRFSGAQIATAPTPALTGERIYPITWTPAADQYGANRVLSAVATDSAGQTTELTTIVNIKGPPKLASTAGTISGKENGYALVGHQLTCAGGDQSYPAATLTYAWTAGNTPVGTGLTYSPTAADQGKLIVCTVKGTNGLGTKEQAGGPVLVAQLPKLASGPTLSGAAAPYAVVGETLSCTATAAATNPTSTVSLQWLRDGVPVDSGPTHTVLAADALHLLACQATAAGTGGSTSATAGIEVGGAPSGGLPTVSGTGAVGATLTCDPGTWSAVPTATVATAWLRDGVAIAGAEAATYKVSAEDEGAGIACKVTATNALGSTDATSAATSIAKKEVPVTEPVKTPPDTTPTPTPAKPPLVEEGTGKVSGAKATVATLACEAGPCTVKAPETVKVKIGKKTFTAKVIAPDSLAAGATGAVVVKLPPKALKALAKSGHSAKVSFTVTVKGAGGTTTEEVGLKLTAAPAK